MDRNESWMSTSVAAVVIHGAWGQVQITGQDVPELRLNVSGSDAEVSSLRVQLEEGRLTVGQPNLGISGVNVMEKHWLNIFLQVPRDWKGQVDVGTTTGRLTAAGLKGTDLRLDSVSGDVTARDLSFMTGEIKTVTGRVDGSSVRCDSLSVLTVSGDVHMSRVSAGQLRLNCVTSDMRVSLEHAYDQVNINTVTGGVALQVPMEKIHVARKAPAGHVQLWQAEEDPDAPVISMNTVSGDLEVTGCRDE